MKQRAPIAVPLSICAVIVGGLLGTPFEEANAPTVYATPTERAGVAATRALLEAPTIPAIPPTLPTTGGSQEVGDELLDSRAILESSSVAEQSAVRPLASYTDATLIAVEFGFNKLAALAAGDAVTLRLATGESWHLTMTGQRTFDSGQQRIDVDVDGWPGLFTVGPNGFHGTLASPTGALMVQGNRWETRALNPRELTNRLLYSGSDARAPFG